MLSLWGIFKKYWLVTFIPLLIMFVIQLFKYSADFKSFIGFGLFSVLLFFGVYILIIDLFGKHTINMKTRGSLFILYGYSIFFFVKSITTERNLFFGFFIFSLLYIAVVTYIMLTKVKED